MKYKKLKKYQSGDKMPYLDPFADSASNWEYLPDMNQEGTLGQGSIGSGIGGIKMSGLQSNQGASLGQKITGALPVIGAAAQLGMGIAELVKARRQKRYFKRQQEIYASELNKAKEAQRANDFYYTPYSQPAIMQDGGMINNSLNSPEFFMDYYNQQQNKNNNILNLIQGAYQEQNQINEDRYRNTRQQGFGNIVSGGMGLAKSALGLFQDGGQEMQPEAPEALEAPDTESLYSPDFVMDFGDEDTQMEAEASLQIEEDDFDNMIGEWLTESSYEKESSYSIQANLYGDEDSPMSRMLSKPAVLSSNNYNNLPIGGILQQFQEEGISTGSVNTGKHLPHSKHYSSEAVDLPASKNGGKEGLRKIQSYLLSEEGKRKYPNIKIIDEIDKGSKYSTGPHLHIELIK